MKIKKGDNVVVISGKDKGKEGTVSRVMPRSNQLLVDGINVVKKHQKPSGKNQQGGVIDRDMPLDASNVMFVHKGKPTRVGYKVLADGKKVRIARTTGEEIG
jgi:large subunit ribosomal protein L24